ncbi:hypothetical protein [Paenibacillus rhizoplanae]|uniref:hypothetical protein n=1 Tax=Paenibacillus rhizoplanae TaxID=1917181 RepID=UPI00360DB9C7
MKKIWRYIYITSIFGMLLLATACSSDKPDPIHINPSDIVVSNSGDNLPQNPFEMDEKNVVLGSINHYAVNLQADEAGRVLPIQYNGGELKSIIALMHQERLEMWASFYLLTDYHSLTNWILQGLLMSICTFLN